MLIWNSVPGASYRRWDDHQNKAMSCLLNNYSESKWDKTSRKLSAYSSCLTYLARVRVKNVDSSNH
uniref:Uncharacterized protein n=1 Tax=Romanomermis culicivorax TaxID=13658 RepID=A0A915I3V8_ROMCU